MFNSTGNNFGAGVIQFKDVQESNYIVLNAKFTCNPQSAEYQAAEVLEISVPKLSISRSTIAGVVARFKYSETSYGYTNIYDAGTVLKSWVKDANTICIEKLSIFDDRQELIIYIQTLYCMLGQGGNASKGKEKRITCVSEDNYLRLDTSYTICVVFPKWIFYHMMFGSCTWAYRDKDWEAFLDGLPDDVDADVPVLSASNYRFPHLGAVTESRLEEGYFLLPANERASGFENTGNYVFSFGYLVRDYVEEPVIPGRLRIQEEELDGGRYNKFRGFDLELLPSPAMAACEGSTGIYSASECTFTPQSKPSEIPEFDAYFLDTFQGGQGLSIQLLKMEYRADTAAGSIKITDESGMRNLAFKMYDTTIAITE